MLNVNILAMIECVTRVVGQIWRTQSRKENEEGQMVKFILRLISPAEGDMGRGPEHRNTAKKINEHRITARKLDETPSRSHTVRFEITAN